MGVLRRTVQAHYYTVVMLLLVGGFAMLLTELLMLAHTDGIQLVAVGATIAGMILTLAALFVRERAAMAVAVMLIMLSATGVIGVYEHLERRAGDGAEGAEAMVRLQPQQLAFQQDDGDAPDAAKPADDNGGTPPPLAPLSLAGLSIMGAVTILAVSRKEV